jgi:hypothetical protein
MIGRIGNPTKYTVPEEENETPKIKENRHKASGANPKFSIPQVSSIQVVNSILPSYANSVPVQLVSHSQPRSASKRRILGSPGRSQARLLGFILIGATR